MVQVGAYGHTQCSFARSSRSHTPPTHRHSRASRTHHQQIWRHHRRHRQHSTLSHGSVLHGRKAGHELKACIGRCGRWCSSPGHTQRRLRRCRRLGGPHTPHPPRVARRAAGSAGAAAVTSSAAHWQCCWPGGRRPRRPGGGPWGGEDEKSRPTGNVSDRSPSPNCTCGKGKSSGVMEWAQQSISPSPYQKPDWPHQIDRQGPLQAGPSTRRPLQPCHRMRLTPCPPPPLLHPCAHPGGERLPQPSRAATVRWSA